MGEIARSGDGTAVSVIWDCTAGEFEWRFGVDETVHILQGDVFVRGATGGERRLVVGDVAFFASGSVTYWRVESYVRKLAFCRHSMPTPFGLALRAFNRVKSLAGIKPAGAAMSAITKAAE